MTREEHFGALLAQIGTAIRGFPTSAEPNPLQLDQLALHARAIAAGLEAIADRANELASVILDASERAEIDD